MLIIGVVGHELSATEREFLKHPAVAGVILFARNFASRAQVQELCQDIRSNAEHYPLITVDQEGGRVQRFRDGYFDLPCLERIGESAVRDLPSALALAKQHAYVMCSEILASGLDLSFAPVADLGLGNLAIGNRAFAAEPATVSAFVSAYVEGMHAAGMAATLKHFPGHGSVLEDTHFHQAVDPRPLHAIEATDLQPFRAGFAAGADAVMMAHVLYPNVAPEPAGYSSHWINAVLKSQFGFKGVVFSDDIGMAAAQSAGGVSARIRQHLAAGCDVVLACPPACVADAVDSMPVENYPRERLLALHARSAPAWDTLALNPHFAASLRALENDRMA